MLDAGAGRGKLASPVRSHSLVPEDRNRGGLSLAGLSCSSRMGFRPLLIQAQPFRPASARSTLARPLAALLPSLVGKGGAVTVERLTGRACPHSGGREA